jgi:hypothetical protein
MNVLDQLAEVEEQRRLVEAELEAHRHIDTDAQLDAALGVERLEATATRDDVTRFQKLMRDLDRKHLELLDRKLQLQARLSE